MKKLTLLFVFISIFGYAQTTTLPSIQERFSQEFLDMNQNVNNVQSQLFQREMLFQDENYNLRLDSQNYIRFYSTSITSKYEETYDANGNETLYIDYFWDDYNTQSFVPNKKIEQAYDANGNQTLFIDSFWNDYDTQSFIPNYKREQTYDTNGNETLIIEYYWDTNTFVQIDKREQTYDANNFRTNETTYVWDGVQGVYKPSFKMDISIQSETDTNIVREGIMYEYNTNVNTWNELEGEKYKSYWYYTKISTLSADKVESPTFVIYPNPTDNTLFITGNKTPIAVAIYNVLGKEVLSIKNTNKINVQALPSGVYVIRISDGIGQTNRKFIKN